MPVRRTELPVLIAAAGGPRPGAARDGVRRPNRWVEVFMMARRPGWATVVALAAGGLVPACGDATGVGTGTADTTSTSTPSTETMEVEVVPGRSGPPPSPHPHTPPVEFDPIAPLPVSAATDRLVVSTLGDGQAPLLYIDLGLHEVVPLTDATATRLDAAFAGDGLAYTIDDRTLAVIADLDNPDVRVEAALPDDVPGVISGLAGDDAGFVVAVGVPLDTADPYGRRDPGPYVLFGPDGTLQCVTTATAPSPWPISLAGGVLTFNVRTEVDRDDCRTRSRLADVALDAVVIGSLDDRLVLADTTTVALADAASGALLRRSEALGEFVTAAIVADGAIWALADGDLLKLDPETLEVVHRAGPLPCVATPYLLEGGGSLWLVDDCSGFLAEVDTGSGEYLEAWMFPHDDESDQQIAAAVVGNGIWFVDVEQSGEPYRFDLDRRRFERMPIPREVAEQIYAIVWSVAPGPTSG
jgi:hypothetical protein